MGQILQAQKEAREENLRMQLAMHEKMVAMQESQSRMERTLTQLSGIVMKRANRGPTTTPTPNFAEEDKDDRQPERPERPERPILHTVMPSDQPTRAWITFIKKRLDQVFSRVELHECRYNQTLEPGSSVVRKKKLDKVRIDALQDEFEQKFGSIAFKTVEFSKAVNEKCRQISKTFK